MDLNRVNIQAIGENLKSKLNGIFASGDPDIPMETEEDFVKFMQQEYTKGMKAGIQLLVTLLETSIDTLPEELQDNKPGLELAIAIGQEGIKKL